MASAGLFLVAAAPRGCGDGGDAEPLRESAGREGLAWSPHPSVLLVWSLCTAPRCPGDLSGQGRGARAGQHEGAACLGIFRCSQMSSVTRWLPRSCPSRAMPRAGGAAAELPACAVEELPQPFPRPGATLPGRPGGQSPVPGLPCARQNQTPLPAPRAQPVAGWGLPGPHPALPNPREALVVAPVTQIGSKVRRWLCRFMIHLKTKAGVCFQDNREED